MKQVGIVVTVGSYLLTLDKRKLNTIKSHFNSLIRKDCQIEHSIVDIDKWSLLEKHQFNLLIKNNANVEDIVEVYNSVYQNSKTLNRTELFKHIFTANNFLKAYPYCEDKQLIKDSYKALVKWSLNEDKHSINAYFSALKEFTDIRSIKSLLSYNSEIDSITKTQSLSKNIITKTEKSKTIIASGGSLFASIVTTFCLYSIVSQTQANLEVTKKITDTLGNETLGLMTAGLVVGGLAVFSTFKILLPKAQEILSATSDSSILNNDPRDINKNIFQKILTKKLIQNSLLNNFYDFNNNDNKNYIKLLAVLNEKILNEDFILSNKAIVGLGYSKKDAQKINELNINDIHEISMIDSPLGRTLFMKEGLTNSDKTIIKNLSLIESAKADVRKDGQYFDKDFISKIPPSLNNKIKHMSDIEKDLVYYYLKINRNKEGFLVNDCMEKLEKSLSVNGATVRGFLLKETEATLNSNIFRHHTTPQSLLLNLVERCKKLANGEEKVESYNRAMFKDFESACATAGLEKTQIIIKNSTPLLEQIVRTKDSATNMLMNMRKNTVDLINRNKP